MKNFFPNPKARVQYLQTNRSDELGSIWSSMGLDFQSDLGTMRLAQKLVTVTTNTDDSDLGKPAAFEYFDDRWFVICGTRVFKNSSESILGSYTEDASTGFQTNYDPDISDLAVFDDRLWSTTSTTLYSKASGSGTGTWTSRDTLGGASHKLVYFKKFDRLYYIDTATRVSSINAANVAATATTDPYCIELGITGGEAMTVAASSQSIWIGRMEISNSASGNGTVGTISQWDGISAQVTNDYTLNAAGCLALTVYNDIPYAVDSEGRILKYSGYSFDEIARFPLNRTQLNGATVSPGNSHFVHYNGFQSTKDNTLLVLVNNLNNDTQADIKENLPSGIWELDLASGSFTHKYPFTLKARTSSTITDYGQNMISSAGALKVNPLQSASSAGRSSLGCGANYFTDATTIASGIFVDSPADPSSDVEGQKKGYFVTTWFNSAEIEDKWTRLWATYRRMLASDDSIVFKYRTIEEAATLATITWVNTTSFTTTTDITAYGPTATGFNGTSGGEVEVLQGTGSGTCYHITSVVNNAGTYTVTLDTAVTGVTTGTAKARFQKWIKLFPEITGQIKSWEQMAIGANQVRIQIKGCLSFTGDGEFYKLAVFSNEDIKINA